MTIGSALLGLALFLLVGLYVTRPLVLARVRRRRGPTTLQGLAAQKEAIVAQIRELDFEFETGKVPEAIYRRERALYFEQATTILKQLDALGAGSGAESSPVAAPVAPADQLDSAVEAAIARRRGREKQVQSPSAPPRSRNGKANYCPQCGEPTDDGDKFCSACGHPLRKPQPV